MSVSSTNSYYNALTNSASAALTTLYGSSSSSSLVNMDLSSLYSGATDTTTFTKPKTLGDYTPWDSKVPKTDTDILAKKALAATRLIQSDLGYGAGSNDKDTNDKKLFVAYNAMDQIRAMAEVASSKSLTADERTKLQARINKGLAEIKTYVAANQLTGANWVSGQKFTSLRSEAWGSGITGKSYTTDALVKGDENTEVPQWAGNVKFSVAAKNMDGTVNSIEIDLSGMGSTPRTVANVAMYMNSKLAEAGIVSRFSNTQTNVKSTIKGVADTFEQHLKLTIDDNETISFTPSSGDTQSTLTVVGGKTVDKVSQNLVSQLDINGTGAATVSRTDFKGTDGIANIKAMATDADGNVYVIADTTGKFANFDPKAAQDVVLQKIDSTGKVVFSRTLGSQSAARGYSIAVNKNDGTIAIAGSVDGKIDTSTGISGDGTDSFVAAFDENGKDLWTHQQGATGTDKAVDIKFADDGTLIVLGQTTKSMGGASELGGTDTYVQALDKNGNATYTKSIGTSGNDTPVSLQVTGTKIYAAWNDDANLGHLTNLNLADGSVGGADVLGSDIGMGRISQFALDASGNAIFAGEKTAGTGMYDQLKSVNLSNNAINFVDDFAGSPIRNMSINGNRVDIAFEGVADENAADTKALQTALKGFSTSDGSQIYSAAVQAEAKSPVFVIGEENQSKSLEALGLPQGKMLFGTSQSLTDVTGLHAGDFFYVAANGGTKRKITIDQGETIATLTTKLNNTLSRYASVTTLSKDGGKYLSIMPSGKNKIQLTAGDGVKDALSQLGLEAGVAQSYSAVTTDAKTGTKSNVIIALDLPDTSEIDLSDKTKAKTTLDAVSAVLTRIRTGYRDISTNETMVALRKQSAQASTKKGASSSNSSAAIAAYKAQTASMQAALAKLTGG